MYIAFELSNFNSKFNCFWIGNIILYNWETVFNHVYRRLEMEIHEVSTSSPIDKRLEIPREMNIKTIQINTDDVFDGALPGNFHEWIFILQSTRCSSVRFSDKPMKADFS